jgi:hypothetical protein
MAGASLRLLSVSFDMSANCATAADERLLMMRNTAKALARSATATTVKMTALDLPPELFMRADLGEAGACCQHGMDPTSPARGLGTYRRA